MPGWRNGNAPACRAGDSGFKSRPRLGGNMPLKVFNTLGRKLEAFEPVEPGKVKIYVCGPTVYSPAHLGHARTYVAFDIMIRFLKYLGYKVFYVRNFTDVGHLTEEGEDKIVKGARREKLQPMELVDKYIREFEEDMQALGCIRPNIQPRATGHIVDIIEATKKLLEKGYAYEVNGTVYYDVSKFEGYGKLSGVKKEELIKHRVEPAPGKRNPADFALWKKADEKQLLKWPSPWGLGFPGWHIECSVMSMKYLGETFDIHGGAQDLIFPHHENEIAQSEALTGKQFVKYWLHTGLLTINGEKMAKSLGNFITIRELLSKYDAEVFRVFVASSHYRSSIDFSEKAMKDAEAKLDKLYEARDAIELALTLGNTKEGRDEKFEVEVEKYKRRFIDEMENDFNTPAALATLLELARVIVNYSKNENPARDSLVYAKTTLLELGDIFGILKRRKIDERTRKIIQLLVDVRNELRKKGEFEITDEIRAKLRELGIELQDRNSETRWRVKGW